MNHPDTTSPFIFFLSLEDNLPASFYIFHRTLRDLGFMLVPVKIDQLQSLTASAEQEQIIVVASVTDSREYKIYNEKVRGLLKFVLKSKRITFMNLASFAKLDDSKFHALRNNYYFLKYPLDARLLSAKIARYHELKVQQNSRWPGGKRSNAANGTL
jgi:hypothetical protein